MAGYQPARSAVGESVAEFMERRRREGARLGNGTEAAAHEAWAAGTRTGENPVAARPSDVLALGAQALARQANPAVTASRSVLPAPHPKQATNMVAPAAVSRNSGTIEYGALHANLPSDEEMAELRRQQAAFSRTARQIDIQNSWFAAPALAAPVAIMGLEAAGGWLLGETAPGVEQGVANFLEREPYVRVGDNWSTRVGRRAHAALKEQLAQKPGWDYEPRIERPGQRPLRPDAGTPPRNPLALDERNYIELKPNTPSGRAAAERAVKRYLEASGRRVRKMFYDPGDFM